MIKSADRQAFLIVTQEISKPVLKLYHRLKAATDGLGDVVILHHVKHASGTVYPDGVTVETFTDDILSRVGYQAIRQTLVPGSNHFPVLDFYLKHPHYQYFWCIEDDVTFTGTWNHFFSVVSPELKYDFISSHLRRYSDIPGWYWWDSLKSSVAQVDKATLINSFNPVYRISGRALEYLDHCLKNGYTGHHEVLMPSLLHNNNFSLADLSNYDNHFTPSLSLCTLRTMRWKPVYVVPGIRKNMLYHPVKAKITVDQLYTYFKRTLQNRKEYFS